jgi:hypothetical protein
MSQANSIACFLYNFSITFYFAFLFCKVNVNSAEVLNILSIFAILQFVQ